jgi:hypothetical protein
MVPWASVVFSSEPGSGASEVATGAGVASKSSMKTFPAPGSADVTTDMKPSGPQT